MADRRVADINIQRRSAEDAQAAEKNESELRQARVFAIKIL